MSDLVTIKRFCDLAACRAMAYQARQQAESLGVGSTRDILLKSAQNYDRLVELFEAHARG